MEDVYKSSLLLIHSIAQLDGTCSMFKEHPTEERGDKIVEIVDKCEEKFLKVKEEIVRMVTEVEANKSQAKETFHDKEVSAIHTEGGFLINRE